MSKRITPPGAGNTGAAGANEHGDLTEKYSTSAKVKTIFKHSVVCGSRFTPKRHNLHYVVNVGLMTKLGGLLSRSGFSWRRCCMCDVIQFPHKTESEAFCCRGSLEIDRLLQRTEELEEENEMLRAIISGMLTEQEGFQL